MSGIHCQELGIWQYVQGEVSLTPTLIPERTEDEGAAKQDHSPGTATKFSVLTGGALRRHWQAVNASKNLKLGR